MYRFSLKSDNRIKCSIVHIDSDQHQFFIQDNQETVLKIDEMIQEEEKTASTFTLDEVKQLRPNAIIIASYEDHFYRAQIQSDISDETVNIYYIDSILIALISIILSTKYRRYDCSLEV